MSDEHCEVIMNYNIYLVDIDVNREFYRSRRAVLDRIQKANLAAIRQVIVTVQMVDEDTYLSIPFAD